MINICKKGYDVNVRKIGSKTNIILPFAKLNSDGTSAIKCNTEKCEFIDTCEYKDYIKDMDK